MPALVLGALAIVCAPRVCAAQARHRVAVLEYRAGVASSPNAAQRIAERLQKTAALEIVDPAAARREVASINGDIARCSGEVVCTAKLGARIGADEVLLVGISQLGDLVLALQRIDVETRALSSQLSAVVPEGREISDEQIDGWLHQLYPPEAFKRYGLISVKANVSGARVLLNGVDRGATPLEGKLKVPAPLTYTVI